MAGSTLASLSLSLAIALQAATLPQQVQEVALDKLVREHAKFDGQTIIVTGVVSIEEGRYLIPPPVSSPKGDLIWLTMAKNAARGELESRYLAWPTRYLIATLRGRFVVAKERGFGHLNLARFKLEIDKVLELKRIEIPSGRPVHTKDPIGGLPRRVAAEPTPPQSVADYGEVKAGLHGFEAVYRSLKMPRAGWRPTLRQVVHPGTSEVDEAAVFELKPGERLHLGTYTLPSRLVPIEIRGVVVLEDGQPLLDGVVSVTNNLGARLRGARTDKRGAFSLSLYPGYTCVLTVSAGTGQHAVTGGAVLTLDEKSEQPLAIKIVARPPGSAR